MKIKKCKDCGKPRDHRNPLISTCRACTNKKRYKTSTISKKKADRLKNGRSEKKLFMEIAVDRAINGICTCEKCGKRIKMIDLTHWNFDHMVGKSHGEEYRLDKNNIQILCVACHFEKTNGLKLKVDYKN